MKRFLPILIIWIFLFVLFPAQRVSAQHGDYPPLPADAWKGQVSGKVVNQTSGETVAEPVEVMLHAWDPEDQERLMVHGKAEHVFFYLEEGQLGVTQFYALSNSGKLTVKDVVTLPRDRTGTLKFQLPEEAQNVKFGNDSSGSRYVLLPGGFADTAPIPPGEGGSQVVVGYNLPYTGKLEYNYIAPVAVEGVSFLVLEGSGLSLEGKGLTPSEERTLQDGSKFNVYKASSLKAGESIQLTLSGQPGGEAGMGTVITQNGGSTGLGIGVGVLGLALVGAGVWWWRWRGDGETEFSFEHKGKIYYFCSPSCLEAFEKDPEAYIEKRRDPWQHVGKQSCC